MNVNKQGSIIAV